MKNVNSFTETDSDRPAYVSVLCGESPEQFMVTARSGFDSTTIVRMNRDQLREFAEGVIEHLDATEPLPAKKKAD